MAVSTRNLGIGVLTVLAGLTGGGLGALLVAGPWSGHEAAMVLILLASTGVSAMVAWLVLTVDAPQAPPAARPAPPPEARAAEGPADGESAGAAWWEQSGRSGGNHVAPVTVAAPPLESYVAERAVVAQCPRCGGFELDVESGESGFGFRCRSSRCGNRWRWTAGRAWPAVVVRRNLPEKR